MVGARDGLKELGPEVIVVTGSGIRGTSEAASV